jgi:hypothetical protein
MGLAATEQELGDMTARFLKLELRRAGITHEELANRLKQHGLQETRASIANKLYRGTITAPFLLATLAAVGRTEMRLTDLSSGFRAL